MENKKQVRLIHIPENISNESVYLCFVIKLQRRIEEYEL